MLDHNLLEVVACPVCKGKLHYDRERQALLCKFDQLSFPIEEGIPVLLEDKATPIVKETE